MRKKFTNHCARKTTVRKLKKAKIVSSEHIANVTGYRGINFLNDYGEAEKVENSLITTAKCCLKISAGNTRKRIKSLSNKKWFDKECRLKMHELRKVANKKHQDPLNTTICEQYHDTLAQYRKLLNSKKNDYYNAKISELEKTADNSDQKTFWQCLKSMEDTRKGEDVPSISEENWLQYFHNLHSNEPLNPAQQNICNELRQNECHGQHSRPLDFMITEREIHKARVAQYSQIDSIGVSGDKKGVHWYQ